MAANGAAVFDLGDYNWRPKAPTSKSKWSCKIGNSTFEFQKPPLIISILVIGSLFLIYLKMSGSALKSPEQPHIIYKFRQERLYNHTYPLTQPVITPSGMRFRIAIIADPDTNSKVKDKDNVWQSYLKFGYLTWDESSESVTIDWDKSEADVLTSSLSIGGRGMELSELIVFNGHLYTVDDRTGVVYRVGKDKKGRWKVIPWVILADGNGEETKGFKCEWMTVKDEHLYVGGLGKEWTTQDGSVLNFNPMYVKRISQDGHVEHLDWHDHYIKLRSKADIKFPGESINHFSSKFEF